MGLGIVTVLLSSSVSDRAPRMGTGGSIYDGQQQVLYWADVSSEVAFIVPSLENFNRLQNDGGNHYNQAHSHFCSHQTGNSLSNSNVDIHIFLNHELFRGY